MEARNLKRGDVVQISPENNTNGAFGGCLMVVTECRPAWVMGYVQALGEYRELGGQAYIRMPWDQVEFVGRASWMIYSGSFEYDESE